MTKRLIGKSGVAVFPMGLGLMGMSDFYGTKASRDDSQSLKVIHQALDRGVGFINTGDFYGSGHNEMLLAKVLKERKAQPFVSVKFGILRTPTGSFGGIDVRPASVKNFAAYSLTRLGIEAIDLYQPARLDPGVPVEETVGAIADLIREGKVRHLGLSEVNAETLRRAHQVHPVTAVEVEYSLATRVAEKELLHTAKELGVTVVAYGVLCRGLLSGGLPAQFSPGDFRAHLPRFTGDHYQINLSKARKLAEFAAEKRFTPTQLAYAWVLHQGEHILPLIGTSKSERLEEMLLAAEMRLSPEDLAYLGKEFPEGTFSGSRYAAQQMGLVLQ